MGSLMKFWELFFVQKISHLMQRRCTNIKNNRNIMGAPHSWPWWSHQRSIHLQRVLDQRNNWKSDTTDRDASAGMWEQMCTPVLFLLQRASSLGLADLWISITCQVQQSPVELYSWQISLFPPRGPVHVHSFRFFFFCELPVQHNPFTPLGASVCLKQNTTRAWFLLWTSAPTLRNSVQQLVREGLISNKLFSLRLCSLLNFEGSLSFSFKLYLPALIINTLCSFGEDLMLFSLYNTYKRCLGIVLLAKTKGMPRSVHCKWAWLCADFGSLISYSTLAFVN